MLCIKKLFLEIGAEIWLGKFLEDPEGRFTETKDIFKFKGYFGVDPTDNKNNYVYAKSFGAHLTIGNIVKAFSLNIDVPEPIAVSGFCSDIEFSFSLAEARK